MLDFCIFSRLSEAREITEEWLRQYNEERPHQALGSLTPAEYLAVNSPEFSDIGWHQDRQVYRQTGDLLTVQERMGHTDAKTAQHHLRSLMAR